MMDIKQTLFQWFIIFLQKILLPHTKEQELILLQFLRTKQLQKAINRKFEKQRVYSSFKENAQGSNLAGMELISKLNKVFHFFLCVIDFCCKYKWAVPLNDKKRITVTKAFQKKLDESNCKPNK